MFRINYEPDEEITERSLSDAGLWVRELIRGQDPLTIDVLKGFGGQNLSKTFSDVISTAGRTGIQAVGSWPVMAAFCTAAAVIMWFLGMLQSIRLRKEGQVHSYDDLYARYPAGAGRKNESPLPTFFKRRILRKIIHRQNLVRVMILISFFFSLLYLCWRIRYSLPVSYGLLAVIVNIILLAVEGLGFTESLVHFWNMLNMRDHPLPVIGDEEYPDVDVFIATYNEPTELLRKTVNGCIHMKYPDKSKVHIWICDDNRRSEMRKLAKRMGVGYFDRPDNEGAKAGNLNHAMSLTSAPYIVTLDADMIPKSDFLLKTIPYFVDVEKRYKDLPPENRTSLGLLQTPQCFYNPDVFQHALYCEKRAPNEQDFFYRSI